MTSVAAGCGSIKTDENILIGAGCGIESDGDSCCCGCGLSIDRISWQECDTLSKKIGFIFGQSINFMIGLVPKACGHVYKIINFLRIDRLFEIFYNIIGGVFNKLCDLTTWIFKNCINIMTSLVTKTCSLISKTISILYIDKLFEVFYKTIKGVFNKLCDLATWIFENCIKTLFINKITKNMVELVKKISYQFNDYLIDPICKLFRKIFPEVSETTIVKASIDKADREKQDSKIAKIFEKFLNAIDTVLTTIFDWTLVPVCNRILFPVFKAVGDIFVGIVGGCSQEEETSQEETSALAYN